MTNTLEGKTHLTPRDLADYDGILYVENLSHSKIFHDDPAHPGVTLELGPVTSETRFGILQNSIARHPSFQGVWRRGQVRVSADPEMEDVLTLSDARLAAQEAARMSRVEATIDTSREDRSLVEVPCLECKKGTFLSNQEITEGAPPLCLDHKHLATTWIQEEAYNEATGEVDSKWNKIKIMKTQPGLSEE